MSDLPMEWFTFKNVYVGSFEGEPVYIRTVIVKNNPRKPKLVMMHGYGTASALFYQCTKSLVKYFQVIYIDIVGMGSSSRPTNYNDKFTPERTIDYFNVYMEKWRIAMGDL